MAMLAATCAGAAEVSSAAAHDRHISMYVSLSMQPHNTTAGLENARAITLVGDRFCRGDRPVEQRTVMGPMNPRIAVSSPDAPMRMMKMALPQIPPCRGHTCVRHEGWQQVGCNAVLFAMSSLLLCSQLTWHRSALLLTAHEVQTEGAARVFRLESMPVGPSTSLSKQHA